MSLVILPSYHYTLFILYVRMCSFGLFLFKQTKVFCCLNLSNIWLFKMSTLIQ